MALSQEARLSFNIAAKWANRFSVTFMTAGVRIAFAEAAPGEDRAYDFHSAVLISPNDAAQLRDALTKLLDRNLKKPGAA
jgi:hypothetical protein